jgi:hypothetical protein
MKWPYFDGVLKTFRLERLVKSRGKESTVRRIAVASFKIQLAFPYFDVTH